VSGRKSQLIRAGEHEPRERPGSRRLIVFQPNTVSHLRGNAHHQRKPLWKVRGRVLPVVQENEKYTGTLRFFHLETVQKNR
jgi:hypothetical protein